MIAGGRGEVVVQDEEEQEVIRMAAMALVVLDSSGLTEDGDWMSFVYDDGLGQEARGILVRWNGELFAFRNLCPHWSTPLDRHGDDLVDPATGDLVCQTHGARFEIHTGRCVLGPCQGDTLQRLTVHVDDTGQATIRRGSLLF